MKLVQLCVHDAHLPALETAISRALSTWTTAMRAGEPLAWESYAVEAHAIRNAIGKSVPGDGCRLLMLAGDVPATLHAVARACEQDEADIASLAIIVRRYADRANTGDNDCSSPVSLTNLAPR